MGWAPYVFTHRAIVYVYVNPCLDGFNHASMTNIYLPHNCFGDKQISLSRMVFPSANFIIELNALTSTLCLTFFYQFDSESREVKDELLGYFIIIIRALTISFSSRSNIFSNSWDVSQSWYEGLLALACIFKLCS